MRVQLLLLVGGWLSGWLLLWRVPRLARAATTATDPLDCSVVVPVRDEERSLPHLLAGLRAQTRRPLEIVVVDDGSTDRTAAIAAADPAVTLVTAPPPPPGWAGKPWACAVGARTAAGRRLVFLDADVRLAPEALAAVVDEHERSGGLLSVQPYHHTERPYEQASAPCNTVAVMGTGMASPGRAGRADAAFGPCLVCDRHRYEQLGGHGAVRGEVIEDVALAGVFSAAGEPVRALAGGELIAFRMYPGGFRQLVEGWTKNMAAGAGAVHPLRALGVALWVTALLTTWQLGAEALAGGGTGAWLLLGAVYVAFVAQHRAQLRQLGNFGRTTALAYPVTAAFFAVVFARSVWCTLVRRRVVWRGRTVAVGRGRSVERV